jgi:peptide/nickel transport system ATP-binding protein
MSLGRIVEVGEVNRVFDPPSHPYTQALLSAIPLPDPHKERVRRRIILEGDLPSPANPPSGCRFRTRCPTFAQLDAGRQEACLSAHPPLTNRDTAADAGVDHAVACHYAEAREVV